MIIQHFCPSLSPQIPQALQWQTLQGCSDAVQTLGSVEEDFSPSSLRGAVTQREQESMSVNKARIMAILARELEAHWFQK